MVYGANSGIAGKVKPLVVHQDLKEHPLPQPPLFFFRHENTREEDTILGCCVLQNQYVKDQARLNLRLQPMTTHIYFGQMLTRKAQAYFAVSLNHYCIFRSIIEK